MPSKAALARPRDTSLAFRAEAIQGFLREAREPGTGKSQHRVPLKPQPRHAQVHEHKGRVVYDGQHRMWCWRDLVLENIWDFPDGDDRKALAAAQPWRVGDRIVVKEAHQINASGGHPNWQAEHVIYAADDACIELIPAVPYVGRCDIGLRGWHSPAIMPRWASRLTLLVTEVRVERLQSISRADAIAEGATMRPRCSGYRDLNPGWSMDWSRVGQPSRYGTGAGGVLAESDIAHGSPEAAFGSLINELHDPRWNYKGDGIWGENPWVCALTLRPLLTNIDALAGQADMGREARS